MTALMKAKEATQTDEIRWQAVISRDQEFDGQFVFAVSSTQIYCKPSCPSRRPQRGRVTFFSLPQEAEAAGFRACLRCRPNQLADPQIKLVQQVCRYLESSDSESTKLSDLAKRFGISQFHLQRTFKSIVGLTPRQFVSARRFVTFKSRVREGQTVTDAMYDAGFNSSSLLYESANDELGMTPSTYSKGGQGANIRYTIVDSVLGRLLVAVTDRGVCSVRMGDTDVALEEQLNVEFPLASITRSDSELSEIVGRVLALISSHEPARNLPIDVRATAFQRQVWEQLKAIPYGETRSYSEIARSIGKPHAVRAVGRACATNPVALVIPCHRVVREDKTLGGYRWGLQRKQRLLDLEVSNQKKK